MHTAKFSIGQVVRHKLFPFRGVVFDVDPEFSNTEEWLDAIPEPVRPDRKQPFYHLFAENEETEFGTLVFFEGLTHVGIVRDGYSFYHASTSQGVVRSFYSGYWGDKVIGFRRVPLPKTETARK